MRILFVSDLHLSVREKRYSFSVLKEILALAPSYDMLFFLGDTFDSFNDLEALRDDFRREAECSSVPIYLLIGNHERIGAEKNFDMSRIDLGRTVVILDDKTYSLINENGVELVAISYKDKYNDYNKWHVPTKTSVRIVLMHGILENTMFFSDEKELAAIPKNIVGMFDPDMLVFGHIHKNIDRKINICDKNINLIYPGSARLCRNAKSESGDRFVLSANVLDNKVNLEYIVLESAGKYERAHVSINGNYMKEIESFSSKWNKNDVVDISISGALENDSALDVIKRNIEREYKHLVRELNVIKGSTFFVSNANDEKIISEFIEIINSMSDKYENEDIELAKIVGIEKIAQALKGKHYE